MKMNKRKEKGNVNAKRESNFAFKFPYLISAALDKLASYAIILFLLLLFFFFLLLFHLFLYYELR